MLLAPFFQTPDTSGYMIAGYIVFISLPILFIVSLFLRRRNLEKDEAAINSLSEDEEK
jgi:hypothetical protein